MELKLFDVILTTLLTFRMSQMGIGIRDVVKITCKINIWCIQRNN